MSTLIPILIPVLMSAVAMIVVLVREGQFQQLSSLLEARQSEMTTLRTEVASATANALSALQRVTETQRRLEDAETECHDLREKLGAVTFQLGQERIKREAANDITREFKARAYELEQRCQSLEQQCLGLSARSEAGETRAEKAEAEAAALQARVTGLLQELQQVRLTAPEGTETSARTAVAAAEVARVERAIHAQTEELLAALAVLRQEAEGFLAPDTAAPDAEDAPAEAPTLTLQGESADAADVAGGDADKEGLLLPAELQNVRTLVPHALAKLTWSQPEEAEALPAEVLQMEAIAS